MDLFSISQLSRFSGILPHTIRIWEKRYNALQPNRSEGNVRFYDGEQLRRLLNLVTLTTAGWKISAISGLSDQELSAMAGESLDRGPAEGMEESYVLQLITCAMNFDRAGFEKLFAHCHLRLGFPALYTAVIFPMLSRIGQMWAGSLIPPAQEHFLSYLIKQKLFTAIDAMPTAPVDAPKWLLFLPEEEFHELGLLYAYLALLRHRQEVIYLGANLPGASVKEAVDKLLPENILLFLVHREDPERLNSFLDKLKTVAGTAKIHIAAPQEIIDQMQHISAIHWLNEPSALEQYFNATV